MFLRLASSSHGIMNKVCITGSRIPATHGSLLSKKQFSQNATNAPKIVKLNKILIANRGEIACRVIRTAKKLGIKTVAVYSDVDAHSDHVKLADEAIHIGPSPAAQSYLRGEKIIEACKITGAQAVHPGYGFLSENLPFCDMCKENDIIFIGPPPKAIKAMGSKSESKDIMIKAKVPVTPGYHGDEQSNEKLAAEAEKIGFPLMIKAVSGGGGKGMRAVFEESKFLESLDSCRREAKKSFNDDNVLLEKLIYAPRHVEVQIFGGPDGKAVHLLERDCSVQRRHQKVLEEAPAPNLDPITRQAMAKAAVACADAVGYVGAGTVEFLVDSKTKEFYFCEMNTRLQVEHPVTELVTKLDLVEWQLLVAAGHPLPLTQEQIINQSSGCAVEARIYAENPMKDFLPATGQLSHLSTPDKGSEPGVRVDAGVSEGNAISTFYDPMIAKLIAFAETREEAIDKLDRALRNFQVAGVANNIDFLTHVVKQKDFTEAKATTAFFEKNMTSILDELRTPNIHQLGYFLSFSVVGSLLTQYLRTPNSIWGITKTESSNWRNHFGGINKSFDVFNTSNGLNDKIPVTLSVKDDSWKMIFGSENNSCDISVTSASIRSQTNTSISWLASLVINGHRLNGTISMYRNVVNKSDVTDIWIESQVAENKSHYQFTIPAQGNQSAGEDASKNPIVLSPMPGKVVKIVTAEGSQVKKGETIAILEAMKMEHVVSAPSDGIVSIFCQEGSTVSEGMKIAEVKKE